MKGKLHGILLYWFENRVKLRTKWIHKTQGLDVKQFLVNIIHSKKFDSFKYI